LKPTVFCSVPRLFNRIYDKVLAGVKAKGGVSAMLFNNAFATKKKNLNNTVNHWLWDRLVFAGVSLGYAFVFSNCGLLNSYIHLFYRSDKSWVVV
jgi:long-subunit acyl-CoA synthetase (AMP-forming)